MFASMRRVIFLSLTVLVLLIAYFTPSAYRKEMLDEEVERLCAIDGGIRVYQTVVLPSSQFNQWGDPTIPFASDSRAKDSTYVLAVTVSKVREETGFGVARSSISKFQAQALSQRDRIVLGEVTSYSRLGGDPVGPWHPSSYTGCAAGGDKELKKRVFVRSK